MEQPVEKIFTYEDYLALGEDTRAELIYGELYMMSPEPNRRHQYVTGKLFWQLENFLKDKPCEVYIAPFDVILFDNDDRTKDIDASVQPDITVICDKSKLTDQGCKGSPDLMIKILSQSTGKRDRLDKFKLYQNARIREYWIVDPIHCTVETYLLGDNGKFKKNNVYSQTDIIKVNILPGCEIDLSAVFPKDET